MITNRKNFQNCRAARAAFSLVETMVGSGVVGIVSLSLFAGFGSGLSVTQLTREDLRATQIMLQRMEIIRLYTWSQVRDPIYNTTTFTEDYDPIAKTAGTGTGGIVYSGEVTVTRSPALDPPAAYTDNMALVKIEVSWTSGNVLRRREMQTFVARYGMQNYIYD